MLEGRRDRPSAGGRQLERSSARGLERVPMGVDRDAL
jgi:hypothetical protein